MAGTSLKKELHLPDLRFAGNVLAGPDAGDVVAGESDGRLALAVESPAVLVKIEVQVVEAVLLATVGKVVHVNRGQVEEEQRLCVSADARLLEYTSRFSPRYTSKSERMTGSPDTNSS